MTEKGASDFREVENRRQAAFRRGSETVSASGRSPTDDAARDYPYMLALGLEDENLYPSIRGAGGARQFFGERGIKWWRHCGFDDLWGANSYSTFKSGVNWISHPTRRGISNSNDGAGR